MILRGRGWGDSLLGSLKEGAAPSMRKPCLYVQPAFAVGWTQSWAALWQAPLSLVSEDQMSEQWLGKISAEDQSP